jgi:homoserine kinase
LHPPSGGYFFGWPPSADDDGPGAGTGLPLADPIGSMTDRSTTAFAPASVGNVGVGFDTLGHAVDFAGDTVTLRSTGVPGIRLGRVSGLLESLPSDPLRNTALRPLLALASEHGIESGVVVDVCKGIPLGSGMGGSAASAVAAVVAANAHWGLELGPESLLGYAMLGEMVASDSAHADNAAPSLYGGLVLCEGSARPHVTSLPVPAGLRCVLVHPEITIETRTGRSVLGATVPLADHVRQSQYLAGFVAGCLRGDLGQIERCLKDIVVEPQRQRLIPGFEAGQRAAMDAGALGCSISGSGPSVFAWCRAEDAEGVKGALLAAFEAAGPSVTGWISRIDAAGARLLETPPLHAAAGCG